MSKIAIFDFNGASVRTVMIDGDPWWVAKDVCDILEIGNSRMATSKLDGDDVSSTDTIDSMGRTQQASIINESGLYDLILDSRKPQAKAFRRWITSEVIPSIRKTGSYAVAPLTEIEMARKYLANLESLEEAKQKIAIDAPKVEGYEDLMEADGFFTMEATAKSLASVTGGLGRTRLFKELRSLGIIMKDSTLPYQHYIDSGYFIIRLEVNDKGAYPYAVTTVRGLEWLRKKFRDAT